MLTRIWQLISTSFIIWNNAKASRMAAALTYYTMLSLAPLLMIAVAIAGYIYDNQVAEAEIINQVKTVTTPEIAKVVARIITNAAEPNSGLLAGTVSLCIFVFGASGVFTQLYETFNDIWGVCEKTRSGIWFSIQKRLIGISMVLIVGLLLMASLTLDSTMAYLNQLAEGHPRITGWLNFTDRSLSFLLMPLVFSMVFWFFPATKIQWRDVWPASVLTAVLVAFSRYAIGWYLQMSTANEVYGASGSLVMLLVWIYMTAMVVFYGAAFSHAWANTFGSRKDLVNLKPAEDAEADPASDLTSGANSGIKATEPAKVQSPIEKEDAVTPLAPSRR
ncbi:MAG: YihY/virulence factor BrkB family protein [Mariniblastus sp.]